MLVDEIEHLGMLVEVGWTHPSEAAGRVMAKAQGRMSRDTALSLLGGWRTVRSDPDVWLSSAALADELWCAS